MTKADPKLTILVNPKYDWEAEPEDQPSYVNPVRLNDHAIYLANAALRVGLQINKLNGELAEATRVAKDAEAAYEDFEQDLLTTYPPNTTASKNNRLIDRHLRDVAQTSAQLVRYGELRDAVRHADTQVTKLKLQIDGARTIMASIKLAGEHIQTHLSFVKAEAKSRL